VTVASAFLRVNGYVLEFDDLEAYSLIIRLYENNQLRFGELEEWLRQHVS